MIRDVVPYIKFNYNKLLPLEEMKESLFQRTTHSKEQIQQLAKIMLTHGVRQPIHISTRSNTICFGHGRKEAAILNGWTHYPVVFQEFESEDEEYSCVQSDNAIATQAELEIDAIKKDIQNLKLDIDLDLLGIKDFKIDEIQVNDYREIEQEETNDPLLSGTSTQREPNKIQPNAGEFTKIILNYKIEDYEKIIEKIKIVIDSRGFTTLVEMFTKLVEEESERA